MSYGAAMSHKVAICLAAAFFYAGVAVGAEALSDEDMGRVHIDSGDVFAVMGASASGEVTRDTAPTSTTAEQNTLAGVKISASQRSQQINDESSDTPRSNSGSVAVNPMLEGEEVRVTGVDNKTRFVFRTDEVNNQITSNTAGNGSSSLNMLTNTRIREVNVRDPVISSGVSAGDYSVRNINILNNVIITPR